MLERLRFKYNLLPAAKLLAKLDRSVFDIKHGTIVFDRQLNIHYDLNSDIGKLLYLSRRFEQNEIDFFGKLIHQKGECVVLDIGANIGLHSINWSKQAPAAKFYSFEPSRNTVALLQENIQCNQLQDKITVVQKALADREGVATFFDASDNAYSSLKDTKRKNVDDQYEVVITPIDHFVNETNPQKIGLVKIDVEGFETEVIKGGLKTFAQQQPDLFVEIYGGTNSNKDPEETIRLLTDLGYKAYIFREGQPEPYVRHNDKLFNYYFTFGSI
jgi:FkbM family methyltransferase